MKVLEENRNMVLLAAVALVCGFIALVAAAFEPSASTARTANQQAALVEQTPVRVVGVPFVPNTNPSEHR